MDLQEFVNRIAAYEASNSVTKEKAIAESIDDLSQEERLEVLEDLTLLTQVMAPIAINDTLEGADLNLDGGPMIGGLLNEIMNPPGEEEQADPLDGLDLFDVLFGNQKK